MSSKIFEHLRNFIYFECSWHVCDVYFGRSVGVNALNTSLWTMKLFLGKLLEASAYWTSLKAFSELFQKKRRKSFIKALWELTFWTTFQSSREFLTKLHRTCFEKNSKAFFKSFLKAFTKDFKVLLWSLDRGLDQDLDGAIQKLFNSSSNSNIILLWPNLPPHPIQERKIFAKFSLARINK